MLLRILMWKAALREPRPAWINQVNRVQRRKRQLLTLILAAMSEGTG